MHAIPDALEVCSWWGAIQIHLYLYLYFYLRSNSPSMIIRIVRFNWMFIPEEENWYILWFSICHWRRAMFSVRKQHHRHCGGQENRLRLMWYWPRRWCISSVVVFNACSFFPPICRVNVFRLQWFNTVDWWCGRTSSLSEILLCTVSQKVSGILFGIICVICPPILIHL